MMKMKALAVVAWLMMAAAVHAAGGESLPVEVTYIPADAKTAVTVEADLFFDVLPATIDGKKGEVTKGALMPSQFNPATFTKVEGDKSKTPVFVWRSDAPEPKKVVFSFEKIPVAMGVSAEAREALEGGFQGDAMEELAGEKKAAAFRLELREKKDIRELSVADVVSMRFLKPDDAKRSEEVSGRFVTYSKKMKGSEGRVRLEAATFVGGGGNEVVVGAAFLKNGDILAGVAVVDGGGLGEKGVSVLGKDPSPLPAAPEPTTMPAKNAPVDPRTTLALVRYTDNLSKITQVVRCPWGAVQPLSMRVSPSGEVYVLGKALENFGLLESAVKVIPLEVEESAKRETHFLAKVRGDGTGLEWMAVAKRQSLDSGFMPKGEVLVEFGGVNKYIVLSGEGAAVRTFAREASTTSRRCGVAVSPVDGTFYFGGDYHSGTGHEPYRNPYLYRFGSDGKILWTAWNWSGPLVGMEYFRQVSDSAIRRVGFTASGDLLLFGWSDGGNSVFRNAPYDLEKSHGQRGVFDDMSAAQVGSFAHLLRMNAKTQEIQAATMVIPYQPFTNRPNSATIADMHELGDGRIVIVGGSANGLIETPDAFVEPWVKKLERDPQAARPHGGAFVMIFDATLKTLLFSSLTPGMGSQSITSQGSKLLICGSVPAESNSYNVRNVPPVKNAAQGTFGGGRVDGYLMLIETQAEKAR